MSSASAREEVLRFSNLSEWRTATTSAQHKDLREARSSREAVGSITSWISVEERSPFPSHVPGMACVRFCNEAWIVGKREVNLGRWCHDNCRHRRCVAHGPR